MLSNYALGYLPDATGSFEILREQIQVGGGQDSLLIADQTIEQISAAVLIQFR